ncbi:uncharacterized protein [Nicotiana sylvestris]|uniref:Uncharacterized protein LOC104229608 n=1 Tax=Nicotiana sylvestris TaxID=4096 RepID=A0A1U7X119_NICSY|nr:PREDICTED: uncharacterized protein LOC104229608 [Nicotiana sylvestris]
MQSRNNAIIPRKPTIVKFENTKRRRLTPVEMEEKRAQGLCFFCDKKYVVGHKCQAKRQLFSLEVEECGTIEEEQVTEGKEEEEEAIEVKVLENCAISLQALKGTMGYQTLRLRSFMEQQPLEIFIDCRSTHNFIDEYTSKRLGCKISKIKHQLVQVADGREVPTDSMCKGFQWLMQGTVFQDDFLVFPIGKSDLFLGIQWLYPLDDIKFNFKKLLMEFEYQGKLLTLRGIQPKFKTMKAKSLEKIVVGGSQLFMVKVHAAGTESTGVKEGHIEEQPTEVKGYLRTFSQKSKCVFAAERIEYLGHYIAADGVSTDPRKVEAVSLWHEPQTVTQLRGFLGLAGYYRRFIRNYGIISKPLTDMLRKDSFFWSEDAKATFQQLKESLTTAPVLALPNFSLVSVVETDACNVGIGAVLMQKGHPIAFLSKGLTKRHHSLFVYEKELLALVLVVNKWSQYLTGRSFIVRTDQKALKFLLEQKLHTGTQLNWITKLMQFNFEIEYKKGRENKAVDALSRLPTVNLSAMTLSTAKTDLLELIMKS